MKTILVATDGSDHAQRALELAADIAGKYDGRLILLHVIDSRSVTSAERHLADVEFADRLARHGVMPEDEEGGDVGRAGVPTFLHAHGNRDQTIKTVIGEGILERAQGRARELGIQETETVLESGDAARKIVDVAEERGANLIVIGTRGLSDFGGLFLGSVSHKVNHLSKVNVITVR